MKKSLLLMFVLLLVAIPAAAEEKYQPVAGDLGIVGYIQGLQMSFSGMADGMKDTGMSLGFIYHVADCFAIRPAMFLNHEGFYNNGSAAEENTTIYGVYLGLFYYLAKGNSISLYIGPEIGYAQSTSDRNSIAYKQNSYALKLGAQYNFSRNFACFAEGGIEASTTWTSSKDTTNNYGIVGATVGVTLYF